MKSRVQPRLIIIAVCLYFLTILPFALFAQDNKPKKVLVLHSYHRGLSWNDAIDEGIETVFKESGLDIETRTEYMDTKRIHNPGYLRQLFGIYQTKFNKCKFDLIISTDNNALNFLLKHRDELFPQTPVVFCGVNNYQDAMLEGQKLFTGAVEDIDIREILDTALTLHPKTRQVAVYGSDTPTYFANKEHLNNLIPGYEGRTDFRFVENLNIKEVQDDIRKLPDNSLILIISSVRDEQSVPMSFTRGTEEMASVSRVPIYGCWDFLLGHGIVGGKLISGFTQGEAAAKMALRFLHGEKIKNIPVLKESPNRFMFDYNQMTRFGLTPSDLPQGSILINGPSSFYSEHKALVWAAAIAIFSLLLFIAGLGINVFRRKRAEASLRKSEERYRSLFDQSRDAIAIVRQDGILVDVNRSFSDLFGYERETLMQMNAKDLWADPAKRSGWQEEMKEKGFISNYSWKTRRKDGEERDCIMTSTERRAEDGTVQYQTIARDVTDQNRSVEALGQSEEKYRTLVEESFDGIFVQEGPKIIFANRRLNEMLGYDENELLGMDHWIVYHPEHQEMIRKRAKARMRGERVTTQYEVKLQRKDGTWLYGEIIARAIGLEGKPGIQVWIKDIMERRLAEETLQQSEKRFRDLFDSITDLIYTQDIEGRFLSVNPAMSRILGYDHKYFIGMKAADFMKPQFRTQFENEYLKQIKTRGHYEGISSYFTRDGSKIYLEYRSNLVKPEEGDPYISGMGRDVTERISAEREIKNLQKQMHHAEKMESIGILAGGIAHDFNNLLMGIQGNASLMTLNVDAGHSHHEKLKNIEQYVQKGADLAKQLLGFASGGKYEVKPTDLNRLIKNEIRMFGRTKKEIRVHEKYDEALRIVAVDQGQMAQVMLNLYINAWQAMPGGGGLYVQTENVMLDENDVKPFEVEPGQYVKISVTDTGIGMDEATRQKIFDPFFTTKEMGRGTGLGLASVYGIIKNHSGFITVDSVKGEGAAFNIYLPAVETENREPTTESGKEEGAVRGSETILLVDDEEMILDVAKQMMEAMGYEVLTAECGKEAVDIYEKEKDRISMVALDMIMPDMGGGATYDRLKEINPDVRVLLSSGYSIDGQAREILDRGCSGFIQKPFRLKELSQKLREILDKA